MNSFDYSFHECPHRLHGQIIKEHTDFVAGLAPYSVSVRSHYRDFDRIGKGLFEITSTKAPDRTKLHLITIKWSNNNVNHSNYSDACSSILSTKPCGSPNA